MPIAALRERRIGRIEKNAFERREGSRADREAVCEDPGILKLIGEAPERVVLSRNMGEELVAPHGLHDGEHHVGLLCRLQRLSRR